MRSLYSFLVVDAMIVGAEGKISKGDFARLEVSIYA